MEDILMNYFIYHIRKNLSGIQKISEKTDIKRLKSLSIEGLKKVHINADYIYFSIDNKLYRKLKLLKLNNRTDDYKLNFLNFMVNRSKKVKESDISIPDFYYWDSSDYYNISDYQNEANLIKDEYKNRMKYHNNICKQRLKR